MIDPVFEEAGGGNIAGVIADYVDRSHARDQGFLVLAKLTQHILRSYVLGIVVGDALQTRDVSDGTDGGSTDLANTLGDFIRHCEELIAVIVEQQVVIAEVRSAHVPMEILGLEVEGEHIGKQRVQGSGDVGDCLWSDIGWHLQGGFLQGNAFFGGWHTSSFGW